MKGSVLCDHQANVPKSCDSLFGLSLAISNVWKTWKPRKRVKKEENGTGSLTAHRRSIDSPHIILSFPSHHGGLKPDCRRSWGSALTRARVCVCVCVLQTGSPHFHPPIRSSCGADPPTRVCLLWVLRRLHKDWPAHRWRVSTARLIAGCATQAQALDGVVLARGSRLMAENTDLGTRLVGLLTKWTWNPNDGRDRGLFNMWLNGTLRWESESGPAPQCRHNQRRMMTG